MAWRCLRGLACMAMAAALGAATWVDPAPSPGPATSRATTAAAAEPVAPAAPRETTAAAAEPAAPAAASTTLEVAGWKLGGGRLTLLLRGNMAAVERLRADGRLSVQVHWLGEGGDASGPVTELPVGTPRLASTLAGEVQKQGYFTWHSWAQKRGPSRGALVTWPDGAPVPCAQQQGPCRLSFNAG